MAQLLNLAYLAAIALAFPWLLYSRLRHGKYREGWDEKFWGRLPERTGRNPCLWIHAVSVGEVNLIEPILQRWERLHPDWDCVISTTTQTGYHLAKKKYAPRVVTYCPLDFTWAVRRAMQRLRPTLLVLTELELWPNLVAAAHLHGAKVAIVNGRLSQRSFRGYRRVAWLLQRVLGQLDCVAAQNEEYASRFRMLGARENSLHITGSIKFDGARTNRDNEQTRRLADLAGLSPNNVVFLAGSTQEPEEALALTVYQHLAAEHPQLRLVLVPRHAERFEEVAALLDRSGLAWQRRSKLSAELISNDVEPPRILLVDAIGELGAWWGTASIAFVGGSLTSRGGQNMIEPAAYGAAVCFGPNTWNFRDVVAMLLERQAAVVVNNEMELEAFARRCLTDAAFATALGRSAQHLVLAQQGAADRTIELLDGLCIEGPPQPRIDPLHGLPLPRRAKSEEPYATTRR